MRALQAPRTNARRRELHHEAAEILTRRALPDGTVRFGGLRKPSGHHCIDKIVFSPADGGPEQDLSRFNAGADDLRIQAAPAFNLFWDEAPQPESTQRIEMTLRQDGSVTIRSLFEGDSRSELLTEIEPKPDRTPEGKAARTKATVGVLDDLLEYLRDHPVDLPGQFTLRRKADGSVSGSAYIVYEGDEMDDERWAASDR